MFPKQSSKVFILNPIGEVLYTQRSPNDDSRPKDFDIPGGGLELIDPSTDTLEIPEIGGVRETKEELDLILRPETLRHVVTTIERSRRFGHGKVTHYFATIIGERRPKLRLDPNEIQWAGWDALSKVALILGREDQRYAAKRLLEMSGVILGG